MAVETVGRAPSYEAGAPKRLDGARPGTLPPTSATSVVRTDRLETLRVLALRLAGAPSPRRVATAVAETAVDALAAESVVVGVWDETGADVPVVHQRGLSPAARQRLPAALRALERSARAEREALDAIAEPPRGAALAAVMPPLERSPGIVLVGRSRGGAFSPGEQRFLDTLAAVAALALTHRSPTERRRPSAGSHVQLADMQIDLADQAVVLGNRHAHLTPCELRILLFLASEPGRARTRREILRHVWHTEHVGDERACDAHISNLRRKIERDPSRPTRVVTVRSVGYALRVPRRG